MEQVLIAGGTGFIGNYLRKKLRDYGWVVYILTRDQSKAKQPGYYYWDPLLKEIDAHAITSTTVLINLTGAGIADKRWTNERIHELHDSRIMPTDFLIQTFKHSNQLKKVIQASGGTCYGYEKTNCHSETSSYGEDIIGQLTKNWEASALEFSQFTELTIMRLGIVLGKEGGALPKLAKTVKFGLGAALGSGKQQMPWLHLEDLARFCIWAVETHQKGIYNLASGNCTNSELTQAIAKSLHKPLLLPRVPGFVLKMILGKRAEILLEGGCISNDKLIGAGFKFQHTDLQSTINNIFAL